MCLRNVNQSGDMSITNIAEMPREYLRIFAIVPGRVDFARAIFQLRKRMSEVERLPVENPY